MRHFSCSLYEQFLRPYLDASLRTPVIADSAPLRYLPEVDDFLLCPCIERTKGGRIWLTWFAGGDDERAVLLGACSDDEGRTFSKPCLFIDPGYIPCGIHLSCIVSALWCDPDGRLHIFFSVSVGKDDGRCGVWHAVCDNPDGVKAVWSEPVRIDNGVPLNKPIITSSGDWLLSTVLWPRSVMSIEPHKLENADGRLNLYRELDSERNVHILRSRDNGKSWRKIGCAENLEPQYSEPMMIERKDGSLLLYMRTTSSMSYSVSTDGGETWSAPDYTDFATGSARFFFRKLASGRTLLVRNASPEYPTGYGRRSHMTAFLSEDDGATWKYHLLLDARDMVSYPDGFEFPDGRIMVVYDRFRDSGEIQSAVFTEEDIIAGKDVSGKMELRRPVIQGRTMQMKQANIAFEGEVYRG